jgi:site-specific recombinase XerD
VHFLTAYFEYLLDQGIKTEDVYVGDASRFLRYLAAQVTPADVQKFLAEQTTSAHYARRLRKSLRKFYQFAGERLNITNNPLV